MRAASYPEVDRIFIHPGIKKKLCDTWTGDRIGDGESSAPITVTIIISISRIKKRECPPGVSGCKSQAPPPQGAGCDSSLAWWFTEEPWAPARPEKADKPAPKKRAMRMADLPAACAEVVRAPAPASEAEVTFGSASFAGPVGAKSPATGNAAPRLWRGHLACANSDPGAPAGQLIRNGRRHSKFMPGCLPLVPGSRYRMVSQID